MFTVFFTFDFLLYRLSSQSEHLYSINLSHLTIHFYSLSAAHKNKKYVVEKCVGFLLRSTLIHFNSNITPFFNNDVYEFRSMSMSISQIQMSNPKTGINLLIE